MKLPERIFGKALEVGDKPDLSPYPAIYGLTYEIRMGSAGGVPCLFAFSEDEVRLPLLIKMVKRLQADFKCPVVVVCPALSAYQMERLSEEGVSWIVSSGNMLIPFLGLAVRESELSRPQPTPLSPQAQRVVTHIIDGSWSGRSTTEVAELMGKSLSSASNYFMEIGVVASEALESSGRRRSIRRLSSDERGALLDKMEPFMSSPIARQAFYMTDLDMADIDRLGLPAAGITALSRKTMLADDPWMTLASDDPHALDGISDHLTEVSAADEPDLLLETWRYSTDETDGCVNDVSLYLSLNDGTDDDPRVEGALDELRERMLS